MYVFIMLFCSVVKADKDPEFFEPNIGVSWAEAKVDDSNKTSNSVGPSGGFLFGSRYDWVYLYLNATASFFTSTDTSNSFYQYLYGIGFGWDLNIPVRMLFGIERGIVGGSGSDSLKGNGFRGSLSFPLGKSYFLDLQYHYIDYSESIVNEDVKASVAQYLLSLSFPIEFFYPEKSWRQ
ncbi:MAG: hypothetical protein A2Z20_05165 [Bdellovibrionales bacterium RBG_16_40_8]|nr:MAG: hypothetical protein A2Z20_05165 [Bdellovibrionales bacterium RBG_16_40_8]